MLYCAAFSKLIPAAVMFCTDVVLYNNQGEHNTLCEVEATFVQLFLPVSWIYTLCISLLMWMRISGVPEEKLPSISKFLHAICWIVPFTIVLVVLADARNATEYDWCWLSSEEDARHIDVFS